MNQCFPLVVQFPQFGTGIWRLTDAVMYARLVNAEFPTPLTHASASTSIGHTLIERVVSTMYWSHAPGPNCQLLFDRLISPHSTNGIESFPESTRAVRGMTAVSTHESTNTLRIR